MPRIAYIEKRFSRSSKEIIGQASQIIDEYQAQGFTLTLRQTFYQFVARDLLSNTQQSYRRLGSIISDARRAGLIDWDAIEDRTRFVRKKSHWEHPGEILESAADSFALDMWKDQNYRPEVWCFPAGTPIITDEGLIPIENLSLSRKVLSSEGKFQPIITLFKRNFSGFLVTIKATNLLPFRVTPNHPILVAKNLLGPLVRAQERIFGKPQYIPVSEIRKFDLLCIPRICETDEIEEITMTGGIRSKKIEQVKIDQTFSSVIGLYLAEGYIRQDQRTVQFTFSEKEEEYLELVQSWAKIYGINSSCARSQGAIIIYLYSTAFAEWLRKNFDCGAFRKRLPGWAFTLPMEIQLKILEYHFRGDGTLDKNSSALTIASRSKTLIQQEQLILVRLGYLSGISVSNDHEKPMYHLTISGLSGKLLARKWNLSLPVRSLRYNWGKIDKKFAYFPVHLIEETEFKGEVFNLETEENHSYCMPVAVHNCEKDALMGIIEPECKSLDIPCLACRGYPSDSMVWRAAQKILGFWKNRQQTRILHLMDHDPSGLNMTSDISNRLLLFTGIEDSFEVDRLALNLDQIQKYQPPPNPAKFSDPRADWYITKFGMESWELDALDPKVLSDLVRDEVWNNLRIEPLWESRLKDEEGYRDLLTDLANDWER